MVNLNKIAYKSEKLEQKSQKGVDKIEDKRNGLEEFLESTNKVLNKSLEFNIDFAKETLEKAKEIPEVKEFFEKNKKPSDKAVKAFVLEQLPNIIEKNEESFKKMKSDKVESEQKKLEKTLKPVNAVIERLGKKDTLSDKEKEKLENAKLEKDKIAQEFKKSMENLVESSPELKSAKKQVDTLKLMEEQIDRIKDLVEDIHMTSEVRSALRIDGPLIKEINKLIEEDTIEPFEEFVRKHGTFSLSEVKAFMKDEVKQAAKAYKYSNYAIKALGVSEAIDIVNEYDKYFGQATRGANFGLLANSRQKKLDAVIKGLFDDVKKAEKDIDSSMLYGAVKFYAVAYAEAKLVRMSLKEAHSPNDITDNMHSALKSKDYLLLKHKPKQAKKEAESKKEDEKKQKEANAPQKQSSAETATAEFSKQVSIAWLASYENYLKENEWAKETAKRVYAEHPGLEKKFKLNQITVGEAMVLWKELMLERKRLMGIPEDDKEAYTSADIVNAKTTDDAKRILVKDIAYVSMKKVGVENLKANGYTDENISMFSSIMKTSTRLIKLEEHEIDMMHRKLEELLREFNRAKKVTVPPVEVPGSEKMAVESTAEKEAEKAKGLDKTPPPLNAPSSKS